MRIRDGFGIRLGRAGYMVSGVVAYADEYLGQEVMSMTPQQLYAALHDVRQ